MEQRASSPVHDEFQRWTGEGARRSKFVAAHYPPLRLIDTH